MGLPTLIATIGGNVTPFERAVFRARTFAQKQFSDLGKDLKGRLSGAFGAAAAVAGMEEFIRRSVEMGSRIKEISETSQLTTSEVQEFGKAAQSVGLQVEDFTASLAHLGEARKKALESDERLRDLFGRYGIGADLLKNASDLQVAKALASSMQGRILSQDDIDAFREFFGGKKGEKIIAILHEFQRISGTISIFSPDEVEKLDQIDKKLKEIWRRAELYAGGQVVKAAEMLDKPSGGGFSWPFASPKAGGHGIGERTEWPFALPNIGGHPLNPAGSGPVARATGEMFGPEPGRMGKHGLYYGPSEKQGSSEFTLEDAANAQTEEIRDEINKSIYGMLFKKMNPGEQKRDLERQIREEEKLRQQAVLSAADEANRNPLTQAQMEKAAAEHELRSQTLKSQLQDLIMGQKNTMQFDSLAKIGGFNAFSDVGIKGLTIQQQQLSKLEAIRQNTTKTADPHGGGGM